MFVSEIFACISFNAVILSVRIMELSEWRSSGRVRFLSFFDPSYSLICRKRPVC